MKLEEFIAKYDLTLADKVKKSCCDGLSQMRLSQDPVHSDRHIEDILDLLNAFLREANEVKVEEIDFAALLLAICWHDIWKSSRPLSTNYFKFKFEQYWDGIGSSRVFKKYARRYDLPKDLTRKIRYAVLRHNNLMFSVRKYGDTHDHLEARLLDDLDSLEFWSLRRLEYACSVYLDKNYKFHNPRLIPLVNWSLNKYAQTVTTFSFKWSAGEFIRRRDTVLKRGREIMDLNRT